MVKFCLRLGNDNEHENSYYDPRIHDNASRTRLRLKLPSKVAQLARQFRDCFYACVMGCIGRCL